MQKRLLTEKNLTLERAIVVATAMEMALLGPQENKKKVIVPGHTEEEEINHIGTQKCVGCCYYCGKKGHMASQCHFRTYKCHKCSKVHVRGPPASSLSWRQDHTGSKEES